MSTSVIKDASRQLQTHFAASSASNHLGPECRRILKTFIQEHGTTFTTDESSGANAELKSFWEKFVRGAPEKAGAFAGVLREMRPAIATPSYLWTWYNLVVEPLISQASHDRVAVDDALVFLEEAITSYGDDEYEQYDDSVVAIEQADVCRKLQTDLTQKIVGHSQGSGANGSSVISDHLQLADRIEQALFVLGRKRSADFFQVISDFITAVDSRFEAVTVLNRFLSENAARTHYISGTNLVEELLRCLMHDSSTATLTIALTSLMLILPYIVGTPASHPPSLFFVYSRLLCWEDTHEDNSYEAHSSSIQTPHLTFSDVINPSVLTDYFTFLYGMYPLNLMSYIRKPRRFLKDSNFPGAKEFNLDSAMIRRGSDAFREQLRLHPNFYNKTVEEELIDPKWAISDPSDVVADCFRLRIVQKPTISPEATSAVEHARHDPADPHDVSKKQAAVDRLSPSPSHSSLRSGFSWHDVHSAPMAPSSLDETVPTPKPKIPQGSNHTASDNLRPQSKASSTSALFSVGSENNANIGTKTIVSSSKNVVRPDENASFLHRRLALLQNELSFERWHKAQYFQHIGEMMRKNLKNAIAEAGTLNLINQNKSLRAQLEQARIAREITIKDSILTRKQANNLESNLVARFNTLKIEQQTWLANAHELAQLRSEVKRYRELLVAAEGREMNKAYELEIAKKDLRLAQDQADLLHDTQQKLRELEYSAVDSGKRGKISSASID